jgi:hypothetical protein
MIIAFCILMSIVCAVIGSKRRVGAVGGFFLGLFLSVIGLIIVLSSRRLEDDARDKIIVQNVTATQPAPKTSTAEELQKLADLRSTDAISQEEYDSLKAKLINS